MVAAYELHNMIFCQNLEMLGAACEIIRPTEMCIPTVRSALPMVSIFADKSFVDGMNARINF